MKKFFILGLSLLFIGCKSAEQKFTTEVINNTDERIEIVIGKFKGMEYNNQVTRWLDVGESVEFESIDDVYGVLYPRKYWVFRRVETKANENVSIEINSDGFYVENF